jgi:hypothetical protein
MDAIAAGSGQFILSLHDSDAFEVSDEKREEYDIPEDVDFVSVESFFPLEIDAEGIGTAKKVTREGLERSVDAGYCTEDEIADMEFDEDGATQWAPGGAASSPQSSMNDMLNGYHSEEIVERFGSGSKVRVSSPTLGDSRFPAAHHRFTYVRLMISDSEQAELSRKRSQVSVGELAQSELEEWANENGFEDKV